MILVPFDEWINYGNHQLDDNDFTFGGDLIILSDGGVSIQAEDN